VDTVASSLYQDYVNLADNLEKQLVALYGHEKAKRFFQRMDDARFEAIREAASNDALKRQWLSWLEERARMLGGGKAGKAA
jgi:hypothetical protein